MNSETTRWVGPSCRNFWNVVPLAVSAFFGKLPPGPSSFSLSPYPTMFHLLALLLSFFLFLLIFPSLASSCEVCMNKQVLKKKKRKKKKEASGPVSRLFPHSPCDSVIVVDYFNFHFENDHDSEVYKLRSMLNNCCLKQLVNQPTYRCGHTWTGSC